MPADTDIIAFIVDPGTGRQKTHLRSDAMLRLLDHIGGFWRVVSWLRIVPRPLHDSIYGAVAKRRYRWFGRFDICRIPPAEFRDRFLQ
jgi:predicted DCC family thiol-disulfide oxidoreductase YuxK